MATRQAEGRSFFKAVRMVMSSEMPEVRVQGVNCTGGCACRTVEEANASCSVAMAGPGRFGYILSRLMPDDVGKVIALAKAYARRKDGLLTHRSGGVAPALAQHIATRMPPLKD